MIVPGLNLVDNKWEGVVQHKKVQISDESLGFTTVPSNTGAITTRCVRSMGWETPVAIDENSKPTLYLTRAAPTPLHKDRSGSRGASRGGGTQAAYKSLPEGAREGGFIKSLRSKAWVNQQASRCPFGSDRRFVGGDWLYKTSYLHKIEAVPDRRFVDLHSRHPMLTARRTETLRVRPTPQLVRLINEKMVERSKATRMMTRAVNSRHPLRALMGADKDKKAYLTLLELKGVLDHYNIELEMEELDRLLEEFPSAIQGTEKGFDYLKFVSVLNELANTHPLGGIAGNSWGWKT
eukprot:CAMPEP_0181296218 /NCGR_PEP_ID=MMETSP1101-20121128/4578_1 /TAXON_ID=46948 /ORGANISM="Rhodomonas abbreviata, Strain Caron Lab Isolate" /LENGTH=292 /DNA_ID=CAMNT_0023401051 /DNA_START=141 /DNA_END=1019 /DNA_ORIENTATION=+